MRRFGRKAMPYAIGIFAIASLPLLAKETSSEPNHASLAEWEWFEPVTLPEAPATMRYFSLIMPPSVFDKAKIVSPNRPYDRVESYSGPSKRFSKEAPIELQDLRLVDQQGNEVPYALRIRRAVNEQEPVRIRRRFNEVVNPDRSAELSLELEGDPIEHNEIEIITNAINYRRRVQLDGSDTGMTDSWKALQPKDDRNYLVHYKIDDKDIDVHTLHYPDSHFRFLRVRVFPDLSIEGDKPQIKNVIVRRTVQVQGKIVTRPAQLGPREPVRGDGGPGSAWIIDWGGELAPCEKLIFTLSDTEFVRFYHLEANDPADESWSIIARGQWQRRPGSERRTMEIDFPELYTRKLRLVVTDFNNPPLHLMEVQYSSPARELIFARSDQLATPLRLYFGNPQAEAPRYDFAGNLPLNLEPPPVEAALGPRTPNPLFQPTLKQLSERWPGAVYVVFGIACLVLLGILGMLAREAVRRHDQPAATAGAE